MVRGAPLASASLNYAAVSHVCKYAFSTSFAQKKLLQRKTKNRRRSLIVGQRQMPNYFSLPWQSLKRLPEPQGQGSLRPTCEKSSP